MSLNHGQTLSLSEHFSIISDSKLDVISRATALKLLSYTTSTLKGDFLVPYLNHSENLIRLSAANVAILLSFEDKIKYLSPLLKDKLKSIRLAAARNLVANDIQVIKLDVFNQAFNELVEVSNISSWRGEGRANQGSIAFERNELTLAEQSFKQAIDIDPYFEGGYINLADLYRVQQKSSQVALVLIEGIKNLPKSANLHYAFGLHFIRQKELIKAINLFKKSIGISPDNPQYAYTYILALDGNKQSKQALLKLKNLIPRYQNKSQLKELGLYLSQKLNNRLAYRWFVNL